MKRFLRLSVVCGGLVLASGGLTPLCAQDAVPTALEEARVAAAAQPQNLDALYAQANAAAAAGELDEAVQILEKMLAIRSDLQRVKLDLALLYAKQERYQESMALLDDVMASDPPEKVKNNITKVREQLVKAARKHVFSGTVLAGLNRDTNANSAASSGEVTFIDLSIPLEDSSRKKKDTQAFGALSLGYVYRFDKTPGESVAWQWNTTGTGYRTEQANLDVLDLGLLTGKSGPELLIGPVKLGLYGGYSYVTLDGKEYLNSKNAEASFDWALTPRLLFQLSGIAEDREFVNSPTVSTFSDRSGPARQARLGLTWAVTDDDIVTAGVMWRAENTKRNYYNNEQLEYSLGYMRVLPWDCFFSGQLAYKNSDYGGVDALVSATVIREDAEKSMNLTLGKKLAPWATWTIGYQYRNVASTLQNYEYVNHRGSTSVAVSF